LLADPMVQLTAHPQLSRHTIGRRLQENALKPWQCKMWCVLKIDAEYVARMEDVLDLYRTPPAAGTVVVCVDETPRQLIGEARPASPAAPGRPARCDYEYRRNGTANVFLLLDAHPGATPRSRRAARPVTLRNVCVISSIRTIRTARASTSSGTTSPRTHPPRCTRRLRRPKRAASFDAWCPSPKPRWPLFRTHHDCFESW
jgi:hypothetical protein